MISLPIGLLIISLSLLLLSIFYFIHAYIFKKNNNLDKIDIAFGISFLMLSLLAFYIGGYKQIKINNNQPEINQQRIIKRDLKKQIEYDQIILDNQKYTKNVNHKLVKQTINDKYNQKKKLDKTNDKLNNLENGF